MSYKNKVSLAGSSWGSILALLYTYYHPEDIKGLILSGTVKWGGEGVPEKDYHARSYQHLVIGSEKLKLSENRILYPEGNYINPEVVPIYKDYEIFWGGPNLQPKESLATAPILDSLKKIQVPVLIFNGDREPCTTETDWGKQYLEILPNAELFTIWGACHDPWFANPSKFFEKSREFLSKINSH